jgi:hypothetical protein
MPCIRLLLATVSALISLVLKMHKGKALWFSSALPSPFISLPLLFVLLTDTLTHTRRERELLPRRRRRRREKVMKKRESDEKKRK